MIDIIIEAGVGFHRVVREQATSELVHSMERDVERIHRELENEQYRPADVQQVTAFLENQIGTIIENSTCPECGKQMVLRRNSSVQSPNFGEFYMGCSGYPDSCKATQELPRNSVSRVWVRYNAFHSAR